MKLILVITVPNRSCEKAILKLLDYLKEDFTWIVDIDLEKFFDNVPHDKLMSYMFITLSMMEM